MKFCLGTLRQTSVSSFCILPSSFSPPGGEIESRLAYTQKSEGQNLSGRPLPRCIIRSAPVSDTGGPGAKPGEAANFVCPYASANKEQTLHRATHRGRVQTLY